MSIHAVGAFLVQTLTTDALAGVKIVPSPVGEGIQEGVAWKVLASSDKGTLQDRIFQTVRVLILAFAPGPDISVVSDNAAAVDVALEKSFGSNDYGTVHFVQREQEVTFPERLANGSIRQHLGGIYRFSVKGV